MLQRLSPLFPYLKRYWRSYVLGGLSLIIYNVTKSLIPLIIGGAAKACHASSSRRACS